MEEINTDVGLLVLSHFQIRTGTVYSWATDPSLGRLFPPRFVDTV